MGKRHDVESYDFGNDGFHRFCGQEAAELRLYKAAYADRQNNLPKGRREPTDKELEALALLLESEPAQLLIQAPLDPCADPSPPTAEECQRICTQITELAKEIKDYPLGLQSIWIPKLDDWEREISKLYLKTNYLRFLRDNPQKLKESKQEVKEHYKAASEALKEFYSACTTLCSPKLEHFRPETPQ